jgi:tetratricopeptide (TPR) repeat protein
MCRLILLLLTILVLPATAAEGRDKQAEQAVNELQEPLYNPFVERYILDEVKSLRTELQAQRAEFTEKYSRAQLDSADRAIGYTTSTVNNIFYIIAAAASIFALVGWSSMRDIRSKLNEVMDRKVAAISEEYETRLYNLELKLKDRTDRIISAQEEISRTNTIHSLWMRAGLEATPQSRIEVYDQILEINDDDIEALTYKADAVLELDEPEWALNLCDKALNFNPEYAYAHYQRACANATLGQLDNALEDLKHAVELSSTYLDEARSDKSLANLRQSGRLEALLESKSILSNSSQES